MYSPRRMAAAAPRIDRSIVLVGMMGAGKTAIGRRLAKRLGLPFADSDEEVERGFGCTIAAIFDRFGEAAFREAERAAVARLVAGRPSVIAAGGGAFMDGATRALVRDRCIAVWLDADSATLAGRLGGQGHRPLLRGRDTREAIEELAARRNPSYAEAHVRVPSGAGPPGDVVDAICRELKL